MPCASVLLWELLSRPQALSEAAIPSRTTLIKDITTLVTYCDWLIASGEGNYDLCTQAQAVFSKGLDVVLNGTATPRSVPDELPAIEQEPSSDPLFDLRPDGSDAFIQDTQWTEWLETIGLQSDRWMDIEGMVDCLPGQNLVVDDYA